MNAALITGACTNTGVAIVEKFASEEKNVVFTGRSPEKDSRDFEEIASVRTPVSFSAAS